MDGPVTEDTEESGGYGCVMVVGLIVFATGLAAVWWAVSTTRLGLEVQSWPETSCRILSAESKVSHTDDRNKFRADFTYEYHVNGVRYVGDRDRVVIHYDRGTRSDARLKLLPVGTRTVCFVDPDDPANAILDRTFALWGPAIFLLFGLACVGIGIAMAWKALNMPV